MKYKVGDKVRIKSLEWYNSNKDKQGDVTVCINFFVLQMSQYCGKIATITRVSLESYKIDIDNSTWNWTDEMFEDDTNISDNSIKSESKEIDWEQRQYNLARDILLSNRTFNSNYIKDRINQSIDIAKQFIESYKQRMYDTI